MKRNSGNALFLILIAVALFAAVTYAVAASERGGENDSSREVNLTDSSVLQQYTAAIRGAVTRMTVNGISVMDLEFNGPSAFSSLTSTDDGVFYSDGGAVVYQMAPLGIMDTVGHNPTGQWVYSMNFEVAGVGTSMASSIDGNDVLALLVGIRKAVCEQINAKYGISAAAIPTIAGAAYGADMIANTDNYNMDDNYVLPSVEEVIGGGAGDAVLDGKNEGCYYESSSKDYVFYSVIVGR